ncbi:hypothetical protein CAI21_12395 [Alkalilimnicola ehrlichii]|uniref:Phasin domain-containing protein n=1 Tax=Alkalilimnicola ehrlichii TaxID=351052 RepID=A0A3E0X052_9GAMM|nr:hypothetical protein [Alkalilimnicola ehrlichii]RFA28370.1 hypothetical protein CAI21_12395 [Alkalilimnicola ehrlichii]RFA38565.1 hypothetical protein CAL65_04265 [Alkalilimnicola ehrlichii]
MEQTQSTPNLMSSFAEAARTAWQPWIAASTESSDSNVLKQIDDSFQDNLKAGERLVNDLLQAQAEWLKQGRQLTQQGSGSIQPMNEWAETSFKLMDDMLEMRRQMWSRWFEQARSMDLGILANRDNTESNPMSAWFDMCRQMMERQMDVWQGMSQSVQAQAGDQSAKDSESDGSKRVARVNAKKSA